MLSHILIRDIAIVSRLELDLGAGMTALTGETGAGKSILIDALGLALGDKADTGLIRPGCDQAEVAVTLQLTDCPSAKAWLAEQALDDGEECIVRRLIVRQGRSRGFINGRPASTTQLAEFGDLLVDIHGQHAHQSLLRPTTQRALLDTYGGHDALAEEVAQAHRRLRALEERRDELRAASHERAERLELLRYQVDELGALGLSAAEILELDREQRRLGSLGELQATTARQLQQLAEGEPALQDALQRIAVELAGLSEIDGRLGEVRDLINGAVIQLDEAVSELRRYLDELDVDPAEIHDIEARLGLVHDLARKYRCLAEELPERLAELSHSLAELEESEVRLGSIDAECEEARTAFIAQAMSLGEARRAAATTLTAMVAELLPQLGMSGGRFAVDLAPLDVAQAGPSGLDRIELLISANPGQPLQSLAKVASGGELSRISLAIQVATVECGQVPILVFDEVDVGIGGGVAEIVGHLLRQLGTRRQVLCVTHLPQVAAQAHQQLRVKKHAVDGQTYAEIEVLDETSRVEEIARMLGGTAITCKTRAHAEEMLQVAR